MTAIPAKSQTMSPRTRTQETLRTKELAQVRNKRLLVRSLRDSHNPPQSISLCSSQSRKPRLKRNRRTSERSLKSSARMTLAEPHRKARMPTGKQVIRSSSSNRAQASITATKSRQVLGTKANNRIRHLRIWLATSGQPSSHSLSLLRPRKTTTRMLKTTARLQTLATTTLRTTRGSLATQAVKTPPASSSKMTSRILPTASRTLLRPARGPELALIITT